MTVNTLKDLENVIKLMRRTGVEHIIVDGVEINLGPAPMVYKKEPKKASTKEIIDRVLNPGVAQTPTEDSMIISDGLTEEQMLFYSSQGNDQ